MTTKPALQEILKGTLWEEKEQKWQRLERNRENLQKQHKTGNKIHIYQ